MPVEPRSSKSRNALVVAALLAPPLLSLLLIQFARTAEGAPGPAPVDATTAGAGVPAKRAVQPPICVRLAPTSFTITRGGLQELTAVFWGNAGDAHFAWTASGGMLGELGEVPSRTSIDGYVMGDDFDGDTLDPKLWKAVVPQGASVVQAGGVVTIKHPGGNAQEPAAGLESLLDLRGNFSVEVTITSLEADGMSGAAGLSVHTDDGFEPELRRVAHNAVLTLEATTRSPNRAAPQASAGIADPGGPAKLRLMRSGTSVGYQTEVGGSLVQLGGRANPSSAAPARVAITGASLDKLPGVTAVIDNFVAVQNVNVVWRAPADALPDALYTIKVGDGCLATARIIAR